MQKIVDIFQSLWARIVAWPLPPWGPVGEVVEPTDDGEPIENIEQHIIYTAAVREGDGVAYVQFGPELIQSLAEQEDVLAVCPLALVHSFSDDGEEIYSAWHFEPATDVAIDVFTRGAKAAAKKLEAEIYA